MQSKCFLNSNNLVPISSPCVTVGKILELTLVFSLCRTGVIALNTVYANY